MFKKLIESWKKEWWINQSAILSHEHEDMKRAILSIFQDEFNDINTKNNDIKKSLLNEQQELELKRISVKTEMLKIESELNSKVRQINSELASIKEEHESKKSIILSEQNSELQRISSEHDSEVSIIKRRIAQKNSILAIEEKEVEHLTKIIASKKAELESLNVDLRTQLKVIEAKAHPSNVWVEAFSQGVSKCWDVLLPAMSENLDRVKSKMKDDAIREAIGRLHVTNKK